MAPWEGPRHKTWAANTNVATVALAILFLTWLIWEIAGTAPPLLAQLLGPATGIWFASVAGDQRKRQDAVSDKADAASDRADEASTRADDAEREVNNLKKVAKKEHPDTFRDAEGEVDGGTP